MSISGSFTNLVDGDVNVDIGGTATSLFGRVAVSGAATLNGVLTVALVDGFTPAPGNTFDILTFASHIGAFDTINLPPNIQAAVAATRVRLTAVAPAGPTFTEVAFVEPGAGPPPDGPETLDASGPSSTPVFRAATSAAPLPSSFVSASGGGDGLIEWEGGVFAVAGGAAAPAPEVQGSTWLRAFLLDLAQPDPNRDLAVVLPADVALEPALHAIA